MDTALWIVSDVREFTLEVWSDISTERLGRGAALTSNGCESTATVRVWWCEQSGDQASLPVVGLAAAALILTETRRSQSGSEVPNEVVLKDRRERKNAHVHWSAD